RFYILDLNPKKSFIRWAVDQGLTVFMVSWKSADETMRDTILDDYVLKGQVDAIDTVRELIGVPSVHVIGYCVAGTTLAATLALLEARDEADKVASATFFTAQVDFSEAGDLNLFVDDGTLQLVDQIAADKGYLDGRYMAATFNLLRGRDLIWNYVTNNYLLGEDYPPFDLLHWNSDVTRLPATWHRNYLRDFYRDNKLVLAGELKVDGTPIDIHIVRTPSYVQAGREDHIAPAASVWKITHYFQGPMRFVLAGSGHIAGVVNPPEAQKYQYWTNEEKVATLEQFVAGATEHKGSWWPDWHAWIEAQGAAKVPAEGARIPGKGKLKAIEDAPGSYVRAR
ncbi:MAG: poly[(R)-3-hydroxyalkanoate] polymerase subunit PhaC, partial [Sphingomonadales bacterium]|nr:poly[(R)-3-hydroxyalkanoate] polymerase subunit PhaC [Sphingomonadales bacterium]